jgi:uncharacterized protein
MARNQLTLDPWPTEYESAFQIEGFDEDDHEAKIDADVEGAWEPVARRPLAKPDNLYFIDGVRRIEARVIVNDGSGKIIRGLFGSAAVGAVSVKGTRCSFENIGVTRLLVVGSGFRPQSERLTVGNTSLLFEPLPVPDQSPVGPITGLQNSMRSREAILGEEIAGNADCVFADGPLTYFSTLMQTTVGVIKRLIEPYLNATQFDLVRRLQAGQRTPLFVITKEKYTRYSWYLRVSQPRAMDHDLTGVLRLEVRSGAGVEKAKQLADLSASCIPTFAGESFRDPRAPQNLLPIGALESELRHYLGDALTIRRAIETRLFEMSRA